MRKLLFLVSILFAISNFCSAQVTFQKAIGGVLPDWGNTARQTSDGGYIIAGTGMAGPPDYIYLAYLIKANSNGDILWSKTFQSLYMVGDLGQDVRQTHDGGYALLRVSYLAAQYASLIKTDAAGDTLWIRHLHETLATAFSFEQTSDDGFIIVGDHGNHSIGAIDTVNALLVKISSDGDVVWSKSYGGLKNDVGYSVEQTNDNGYIMTGSATSFGSDSTDVYLVKTDAAGDTLWTRRYGGPGNDWGVTVKQTSDNGYIVAGNTNSFGAGGYDICLLKTNNNGNILWSKTYGGVGYDKASGIQITSDEGYLISGNSNSFGAKGIYLIKTDKLGNIEWSKSIGGSIAGSVQQTIDGGYVFTGMIFSDIGDINVLLAKTDQMGNSGCNETNVTTITNPAAIKMSVTSTKVVDLKLTTGSKWLYFIESSVTATTLCTSVGLNETKSSLPLLISPNPSSGDFVITFSGIINQGTVEIYTVMGERIFNKAVSLTSNLEINLKNSSPGIYFVKVMDGERRYSKKIMIER